MPYPTLPGRRFEYDAGGGSVYYGNDINEITMALTTEQMAELNNTDNTNIVIQKNVYNTTALLTVWVFLPEKYVVAGLGMMHTLTNWSGAGVTIAGSSDSTNGLDGTWINATLPNGAIPKVILDDDQWRDSIQPCTFSEAIKVLRLIYSGGYDFADDASVKIYALHIYGVKAAGEVPDDILFLDDDVSGDPEFIRDLDFGDRPEGIPGRVVKEHVAAEVVRAQGRAPRLDAVDLSRQEPREKFWREPWRRNVQRNDAAVQPDPPLWIRHEHARASRQLTLQLQHHL